MKSLTVPGIVAMVLLNVVWIKPLYQDIATGRDWMSDVNLWDNVAIYVAVVGFALWLRSRRQRHAS